MDTQPHIEIAYLCLNETEVTLAKSREVALLSG